MGDAITTKPELPDCRPVDVQRQDAVSVGLGTGVVIKPRNDPSARAETRLDGRASTDGSTAQGPRVWFVVPTYGQFDYAAACVKTAIQNTPRSHVVLVDDCSPDWPGESWVNRLPREHVTVLRH